LSAWELQEFSGTAVVVVTSEGLARVDDRESRSASGDCESDSNKYEDFFHGRILSKRQFELYHTPAGICDRNRRKLRMTLCEKRPRRPFGSGSSRGIAPK
jgi:hypothetical protein